MVNRKTTQTGQPEGRVVTYRAEKFREVLLYILNKMEGKENIGETVLHKLLYFIDFDYYEKYEESLMGARYIKNLYGPTAANLKSVTDEMRASVEIETALFDYHEFDQKRYRALRQADLSALSTREISHIDTTLKRLGDMNATKIEAHSHGDMPWRATPGGETIDYELVFYRDDAHSVRDYDDEL